MKKFRLNSVFFFLFFPHADQGTPPPASARPSPSSFFICVRICVCGLLLSLAITYPALSPLSFPSFFLAHPPPFFQGEQDCNSSFLPLLLSSTSSLSFLAQATPSLLFSFSFLFSPSSHLGREKEEGGRGENGASFFFPFLFLRTPSLYFPLPTFFPFFPPLSYPNFLSTEKESGGAHRERGGRREASQKTFWTRESERGKEQQHKIFPLPLLPPSPPPPKDLSSRPSI